ncbi:hypothetical protein GOB10_18435 [Sinorhizobium meliloti]|uniref:MT-A70 family methyltransferase n=1 Tax=Rhizobium meliloti TaxID=382 RepID=UPI00299E6C56|nr:hypothetical protein [Sinorhizobium meliloti]MDW9897726.1 hypothetical protein [Sinorhizobium meliloti]MDX0345435.1 hypothetical protein [Sinorhizobium meliloti]MDX0856771.1 hypothetical protein [Sinorhizobium medicae]MDX1211766.1 hypothetical protein [Sinorhizobium medicae]
MLDPDLLAALPFRLRVEIEENICRKDFSQSELAEIQRRLIDHFAAARRKGQGRRTDLTSTQKAVEVGKPKRFENTHQIVGRLFGESEHTVRKRLEVYQAAMAEPERFGKFVADMDRTNRVNGVYRRLSNTLQGDAIRAEPPPLPKGPFRVITADPPWPFEIRSKDPSHRGIVDYPTMTIADISALPVAGLAAVDAVLWLWTTNVHLLEGAARQVLDAWGFSPKTMLTWAKPHFGTGDWLRGQTEHCILAVRGHPVTTLANHSTLLAAPLRGHSEKPDEFYSFVESLCPAPRYLELFARRQRPRWTVWGDEVRAPHQVAE